MLTYCVTKKPISFAALPHVLQEADKQEYEVVQTVYVGSLPMPAPSNIMQPNAPQGAVMIPTFGVIFCRDTTGEKNPPKLDITIDGQKIMEN